MKLFGINLPFGKKALSQPTSDRGGWLPIIRESFGGAWQQNVVVKRETALTYFAVFSCMTLIASDVAKLRIKLVRQDDNGIWKETTSPAFSPVLRKPNSIQTRIQFMENWMLSKLANGNVYVLKERDARGIVVRLYVLDPNRVQPLVSESGDVFYRLSTDNISGIQDEVTVPASEIIHDRYNCFFHPLIGLSPLVAAGLAAMQGVEMQNDSTLFFQNGARPGGILTAPGAIDPETAQRLKEYWDANFSGKSAGKIAVLGDNLKYEAMRATAADSQLIEQLKWTAEMVCSAFHVPPYKVGVGQMPAYNNIQALNIEYYSQALQKLIEDAEACLDEGLGLGVDIGTEFDLENLWRMDSATQMDVLEKSKGKMTVNEQRKKIDLPPVKGGDTVYLQEQDHSLEWLSKRDAMPIEAKPAPAPAPEPKPEPAPAEPIADKSYTANHARVLFSDRRTFKKAA